jgi:hypothetical protein
MAESDTTTAPPVEAGLNVAPNLSPPIAAIEAEQDDYDSAYDAESVLGSTTSIGSSILQYRQENGRTCLYTFLFHIPFH